MSEPITFADEQERPSPPAEPATEPAASYGVEAREEVVPGSAEAVAVLSQQRQQASHLVQAVAFASQKLAEAGYALSPENGSITQKRLIELRDGLERAWRLAVAIEASVKEE